MLSQPHDVSPALGTAPERHIVTLAWPTALCCLHSGRNPERNPEAISVAPCSPPTHEGTDRDGASPAVKPSAFTTEPAKPSNLATFNHSFDKLNLSTSLTQHSDQSELTIDIMPITNKNKLRTATAAYGDPGGKGSFAFLLFRMLLIHWNCNGTVDVAQNEVDENLHCPIQLAIFLLNSLDHLDYDVLYGIIREMIRQSGDHGEAQTETAEIFLQYVYDDEGIEAEPLDGVDDQELRRIIARGSGVIHVVWEFMNGDHN